MQKSFENAQRIFTLETSKEVSDSVGNKGAVECLDKQCLTHEQRKFQEKNHRKVEVKERQEADKYLADEFQNLNTTISSQNELNAFVDRFFPKKDKARLIAGKYLQMQKEFGRDVTEKELKKFVHENLIEKEELSIANQIKTDIGELEEIGLNRTEILETLVAKYKGKKAVKTWVENWTNFLVLNEFASTKPPAEKRAIQNIIAKADFTKESSFATSLLQVSKSSQISEITKFEIAQKFNASDITTVGAMDSKLKQIQIRKKDLEKAIDTKNTEKESLKSEIKDIENQLEALPLLDPKREEIEAKLTKRKQRLKDTEITIQTLLEERPKNVSFPLREGYSTRLNPNGTRTIEIDELNISVQLPENVLFMSRKNMLSINLAFVYRAFSLNGMESIFTPNIENGAVPDRKNRLFGSKILKQLGYPTNLILSQSNILQLQKDLGKLKQKGSSSTGMEDLETLGIWDFTKQEVNNYNLNSSLKFIRNNRGKNLDFEDVLQENQF